MSQLNNLYVSSSFQGLLKMTDSTHGVTPALQTVQSGDGSDTPLQISTTAINISGSLTVNGSPISIDTGSFATTGSNTFQGDQTITGSNGYIKLDGSAPADEVTLLSIHANNDAPWIGRYYNDTFSTSSSVLSFWGDNNGTFHFHNESTASIQFGVNNYGENLILNDTNTTSNRDLIVSGSIKTNGHIEWSDSAFNYINSPSGALYFSALSGGTLHLNDDGGEGDVFIGWGPNKTHIKGDTDITGSLGVTNIKGTGSLLLQPNQSDARYLEIYNTSPTDTHITGSGGQIYIGDDVTYVKVDNYGSVKRIDIVADNNIVVSGSMNVTGSIDITGDYLVNGVPFSGGTSGTSGSDGSSGTSGQDGSSGTSGSDGTSGTSGGTGSSGTSGTNGSSGTSGTNGSSGTSGQAGSSGTSGGTGSSGTSGSSGVSPSTIGFITTGSISVNQSITGSLTNSGSLNLTGSLTEVGNTYLFSPAFVNGVVKLNITGSNEVSQSNLIFGNNTGPAASNFTGSIIITGSNNILLNGNRTGTVPQGFVGYVNGSNNILSVVPQYSTSSVDSVITNNNILFSVPQFDLTTGSGVGTFSNNLALGAGSTIVHRHKSGSLVTNNNLFIGSLNSFASRSFFDASFATPTITANIINGTGTNLLNTSSSIVLSRNITNTSTFTVNNQFTNPSDYLGSGSGSLSLNNNLFGGSTHTILSSGSNALDRQINYNLVAGYGNTLNQISSGSNNTYLINTAVLGQGLIVSGSNTSATTTGGSIFVGRFNATGSLQEGTNEAVFVVGTGTAANARRNAIHVDNNNNTRITGSVSISGSLLLNGVAVATGSGASGTSGTSGTGGSSGTSGLTDKTGLITTGSISIPKQSITGSLNINGGSVTSNTLIVTGGMFISGTINNMNFWRGPTDIGQNLGIGFNTLTNTIGGTNTLAIGSAALSNNISGSNLVAIGTAALLNNIGNSNTGIGANALTSNTIGGYNVGIGSDSLKNNVIGNYNIAIGDAALYFNVSGSDNVAFGKNTMFSNTIGNTNVAIGTNAMNNSVSGSRNMAIGANSLQNVNSTNNTGVGNESLQQLTTGYFNTAIGYQAMASITTGSLNIAIGNEAAQLVAGDNNVAIGYQSLKSATGARNVGVGGGSLYQGNSDNVGLGFYAGYNETGSNNFYLGNQNYGSTNGERSGSLMWGKFDSTTSNQTLQINAQTNIKGSLTVTGGINYSSGSNTTVGTVALDGGSPGSATISNSLVTANSLIFLTKQTFVDTNSRSVAVVSKGSGTFTISSGHNGDTDVVAYQIINPI